MSTIKLISDYVPARSSLKSSATSSRRLPSPIRFRAPSIVDPRRESFGPGHWGILSWFEKMAVTGLWNSKGGAPLKEYLHCRCCSC